MQEQDVLKVEGIKKAYRGFCLENVSFTMKRGTVVGLIGENGAGKTTLISMILNQRKADKGRITVLGNNVAGKSGVWKQALGFFCDEACFHACFNALDVDKILKKIYKRWDSNLFFAYLKRFNTPCDKAIGELSKGNRRKLMLAASLSHRPEILIYDELTSGLDPMVRELILRTIKKYVAEEQASVLFSTHIISDVEKFADEVIFLHEGKIVFYNTIQELEKIYKTSDIEAIMQKFTERSGGDGRADL